MRQPDLHTVELPQQDSELFKDPIAGWTQPWIPGRQVHTFLLGQGFPWMFEDVLLLKACRTLDP
jgi:hypothetical protein